MLRALSLVLLAATSALTAQSPLTTFYIGGNGLGAGATVYFDLVVNAPVTFTQFDVNSSSAASTSGSIDVRWCLSTYVGNDTNAAAWILGGSGTAVSAGANVATPVTISPFTLPPGNYGMAVTFNGIGVSYTDGNGTATPGSGTNQTYTTTELTMLAGASAGGAPGTAICCYPRIFNGSLYYSISGSGTVAQKSTYGTGCYQRSASVYEVFTTSAAFDLANSAISFLPSGAGYLALPGVTTYVAPSATASSLTLSDDSETTVNLSTPFTFPGGSTTTLNVCSNGYVSVGSNGTAYTPAPATMLAAPNTGWWNQHDYNPAAVGSGTVKFEEVGGIAYVTWDGVYDYSGTTAANANTFQFQFDLATGSVHMVFGTMSALGGARMVAYSPGGPSIDPGSTDISVALPQTLSLVGPEQPLALTASARPLIGTAIDLVTSNETGPNVGLNFIGLTQIPAPGIDLAPLGAAGCAALIDVGSAVGNVIDNLAGPAGMSLTLSIPNQTNLLGIAIYDQSIWLDPTANVFGILTSNGLALVLGNL